MIQMTKDTELLQQARRACQFYGHTTKCIYLNGFGQGVATTRRLSKVSFDKESYFYRAFLQKRPDIISTLQTTKGFKGGNDSYAL